MVSDSGSSPALRNSPAHTYWNGSQRHEGTCARDEPEGQKLGNVCAPCHDSERDQTECLRLLPESVVVHDFHTRILARAIDALLPYLSATQGSSSGPMVAPAKKSPPVAPKMAVAFGAVARPKYSMKDGWPTPLLSKIRRTQKNGIRT